MSTLLHVHRQIFQVFMFTNKYACQSPFCFDACRVSPAFLHAATTLSAFESMIPLKIILPISDRFLGNSGAREMITSAMMLATIRLYGGLHASLSSPV